MTEPGGPPREFWRACRRSDAPAAIVLSWDDVCDRVTHLGSDAKVVLVRSALVSGVVL